MVWWLTSIVLSIFVTVPLLPWSVELHLSTTNGMFLRLRFFSRVTVFTVRRGLGQGGKSGMERQPGRVKRALQYATVDTYMVLVRYFRGMIGNTHLEISGEFGLGDPAATGMVYGLACGLCGAGGIRPDRNYKGGANPWILNRTLTQFFPTWKTCLKLRQ